MEFYSKEDFSGLEKYDMHVHVNASPSNLVKQAKLDNFRLLSINTDVPDFVPIAEQQAHTAALLDLFPERITYSTSFKTNDWSSSEWEKKTLDYLKSSFEKGAVAVKVWKNIGMELVNAKGEFIMIDHPKFDPIFDFIQKNNITLIGHLGEPKNCWLPLDKMTVRNDREYFSAHPEYHMFLHPEYPSYDEQIRTRDNMLEKHPGLRFVGAHLGSLEWNVDEVAKRLDRFPSMAVDTAERISHLQFETIRNHKKIYDFFIRYQDRILYGTDIIEYPHTDPVELASRAHRLWTEHWKYFTSDEMMTAPELEEGFRSLHLPREVVDKIYNRNFKKWFPNSRA